MHIRTFRPEDRADYLEMAADFYSGDSTLFPIAHKNLEDTFEEALRPSPSLRGYIVEDDAGKTAGYALLVLFWSCEAGGLTVLLDEIYLRPEARGAGLGSRFMEWLFEEYDGRAKRYRLEVCPRNPRVRRLYERYGFSVLDYTQMVRELPGEDD